MTDKTAAELVSDYIKTQNKMAETDVLYDPDYYFTLRDTRTNIIQEMKEWHEEMKGKINKR